MSPHSAVLNRGPHPRWSINLDRTWMHQAACRRIPDDLWYPATQADKDKAQRICKTECGVREECLAYALAVESVIPGDVHGIWGGADPAERARILARQPRRCTVCGAPLPGGFENRLYCGEDCHHQAVAGTNNGYRIHRARGEEPCRRCRGHG